MNARLVFRIIGLILLLEAAALLAPMLVSIFYKEWAWRAFLFSSLITATVGGTLYFVFKKAPRGLHAREAFALTGFSWLLLSVFGSLPSLISGDVASPYDALFETISGFTTTGASTLNSMEALSNGLLFWRSLTIWIGGMGFLLLFLALLPSLGEKSIQLLRAESPGPNPSKIVPRISDTARILYIIYTLLTLLTIFCFYLAGVPFFDSVVHALSTAGTGGVSSKNLSIGAFDLTAVHLVAAGFMLLFGINF